jgi:ubiquinone/menaquinone biosynthesis C-methylase UbiE
MSATPFDELAADYDATFTQTALGSVLRGLVWERFDALFRPGQRVLELGCGTGEDAVRLAHAGIEVVATDPAELMLDIARAKARAAGCAKRIDFRCLAMETLPEQFAGQQFAGIVSNFGAINCTRDLGTLTRNVADLCEPGATLLWVVMGKHVPWEWAWYAARGDRTKALRRLQRSGVQWRGLRISYPTPRGLSAILRPFFSVTRLAPLGCVLPPSYAGAWLERSPRTLRVLSKLERLAQHSRTLAAFADHYVIEARRLPI